MVPEEAVGVGLARDRRSGVGLVPQRDADAAARTAVRPTLADPAPPAPRAPRAVPDRAAYPAPTGAMAAPEGMPLRYSGSVNGVEVEVRGLPVMVSEMKGARTLYINAEGLWIRITVPREREIREGGESGTESEIRR